MKLSGLILLSVLCLVGIFTVHGQTYAYPYSYGYGGYGGSSGGSTGFFALIGLLFIILILFGFRGTNSSNSNAPTIVLLNTTNTA